MKILAVDPGLATGVAACAFDDTVPLTTKNFSSKILEYPRVLDWLWDYGVLYDVIAYETFTITAKTVKLSRQYHALELIGLLKFIAHKHPRIKLVPQSPADAKSLVSTPMLKKLDWYRTGAGHDNDAARHLVLYLANHQPSRFTHLMKTAHVV